MLGDRGGIVSDSHIPTEVELVYELMPCNALRVAQSPIESKHPCSYFREWGTYHSYDYEVPGAPDNRSIVQKSQYLGRAALVPEMLSGCRKTPILAVGINPNLPGWWTPTRNSVNPLFDEYKQYAHYFRYRETAKLQMPIADYTKFGGGATADPFNGPQLDVPLDADKKHTIAVELANQKMYLAYQSILDDFAKEMQWNDAKLVVGEDLAYANMVACPSAKWTTKPDEKDPKLPPMTPAQQDGIVHECFATRQYFLRQLFQSLPSILFVFSQSTATALIAELQGRFSKGDPKPTDSINDLLERDVRLDYGKGLDALVLFAPHPTGTPELWAAARPKFMKRLADAAKSGRVSLNPATKHLARSIGSCVFCTMLEIGPCDYLEEIKPLHAAFALEKLGQNEMLASFVADLKPQRDAWKDVESGGDV